MGKERKAEQSVSFLHKERSRFASCLVWAGCAVCVCLRAKLLSRVQFCATSWTVARQAPLSMGFSRQEYCSGQPFPPLGDLPNPGIEPSSLMSSALAGRFFTLGSPGQGSLSEAGHGVGVYHIHVYDFEYNASSSSSVLFF